ncbi:Ubiquitin-like protein SMT3 [Yarrowia sp. B02]|nr:Ubiquitin-like protein SMT3 [Yarrowia sp. B02]
MSEEAQPKVDSSEHVNIKVTDSSSEIFFKIKKSTQLKKLIDAFCQRQGKQKSSLRFLYDGQRVTDTDTPETLQIEDGDTIEAHQEQLGGC